MFALVVAFATTQLPVATTQLPVATTQLNCHNTTASCHNTNQLPQVTPSSDDGHNCSSTLSLLFVATAQLGLRTLHC